MAVVTQDNRLVPVMAALGLLMLTLLSVAPAHGVVLDDLYRVSVPISDDSEAALARGFREGLETVLVRVSGERDIAEREDLGETLEDAGSLVDRSQVDPGEDGTDQLHMQFSRSGVNQALAEAGAKVWGANRPLTLAWVAVQDGGDRGLLAETGEASEQGWSALLSRNARERGLPLTLPPADRASDRRLLSDVWGQFMYQVSRASSGLEHDLLAVVRIGRQGGGWQASWLYEGAGIEQSRTVSADTPEALVSDMVDAWASDLASRFAVSGSRIETGPRVRLVLEGITSPADYASAKQALSRLNPVESIGAVEVSAERIVFLIEHTGEREQLQQNIALDQRFRPLASAPQGAGEEEAEGEAEQDGFGTVEQVLYYRWQEQVVRPSEATRR